MKSVLVAACLALAFPAMASAQSAQQPRASKVCSFDPEKSNLMTNTDDAISKISAELKSCAKGDIVSFIDLSANSTFELYIASVCDYTAAIRVSELRMDAMTATVVSCVYEGHVRPYDD